MYLCRSENDRAAYCIQYYDPLTTYIVHTAYVPSTLPLWLMESDKVEAARFQGSHYGILGRDYGEMAFLGSLRTKWAEFHSVSLPLMRCTASTDRESRLRYNPQPCSLRFALCFIPVSSTYIRTLPGHAGFWLLSSPAGASETRVTSGTTAMM
jgi:hypothetical protein